ncbi:Shedu immune nuclease family protein [Elizabethkingia anophelis]|uniref:Shedu protein SduA C-terminal domain-containing protein n=1 Tax=Elizabethkingia anophelis TaxID=1117645 RepID=A0A494J3U6_9FLAO|nr:Shedu immune nuclease family protein [Elizabethkingia anophelis]AQX50416.1 hypothetical protein AYC66_06900 [Elizabethkingia anophelis]MCT4198982.1 DUF4263 domain-containing protein [Elizabethkingia anophelis]MCT4227225.1 DUF4263 domain-containing protein [Elizabethkingia anophelis]MCT4309366.1 DUF4263 domain-containing protein [Elizabethkingia anophelis]MDV2473809.1 DUF4263 domain-containing protein [Elizabethkingia anophelis]
MAKFTTESSNIPTGREIWVIEDEDPTTRRLAYTFNTLQNKITFYPKENDFELAEITLDGFTRLPEDFSENGYIKQSVQYYLNKKIQENNITKLTITNNGNNSYRKNRNEETYSLTLKYEDFKTLRENFIAEKNQYNQTKNDISDNFFFRLFPTNFPESTSTPLRQKGNFIRNLNAQIIPHLTVADLQIVETFISELLKNRYQRSTEKFLQLARTKIQVDNVAIDRILSDFQKNLDDNISENAWGKYLQKNLFLLESKYVKILPELNVILRGSRNVDFGMIDTKGYLDIFEIKKPTTSLLSADTDRGNYYWHSETVKAIVQAEKYLYNAERKASTLAEDIQREDRIEVKVIKPRAILIIGHSNQLDNDEKKADFKVLRNSLKNIEILLYDELVEGMENQKNKYYDLIIDVNA